MLAVCAAETTAHASDATAYLVVSFTTSAEYVEATIPPAWVAMDGWVVPVALCTTSAECAVETQTVVVVVMAFSTRA